MSMWSLLCGSKIQETPDDHGRETSDGADCFHRMLLREMTDLFALDWSWSGAVVSVTGQTVGESSRTGNRPNLCCFPWPAGGFELECEIR